MKTMSVFSNAGWDNDEWVMADGEGFPHLAWQGSGLPTMSAANPIPLVGLGTKQAPYQIRDSKEIALLSWYSSVLDKHIVLMKNIDLSGQQLYPIGDLGFFTGVFDGKGHIISNATIDQPEGDYIGLFGNVGDNGVIENIEVDNIEIVGFGYVGGLAGNSFGDIRNCKIKGAITGREDNIGGLLGYSRGDILDCCSEGSVVGDGDNVGGLAGFHYSDTVSNSYSNCRVSGTADVGGLLGHCYGFVTNSYSIGPVRGRSNNIGGLVGYSYQCHIYNCYAEGTVIGSSENSAWVGGLVGFQKGNLIECYSVGPVSGKLFVGGIVGSITNTTISNTFWDVETSGVGLSGDNNYGATGKNTAQMKTQGTYTDWNFHSKWRINDGLDYPKLGFQPYGDLNNDSQINLGDFLILSEQLQLQQMSSDIAPMDNPDEIVDFLDLHHLAGNWLQEPHLYLGDVNGDYCVDLKDINKISAAWLSVAYRTPNWDVDCEIYSNKYSEGVINFADFSIIVENWLSGVGP